MIVTIIVIVVALIILCICCKVMAGVVQHKYGRVFGTRGEREFVFEVVSYEVEPSDHPTNQVLGPKRTCQLLCLPFKCFAECVCASLCVVCVCVFVCVCASVCVYTYVDKGNTHSADLTVTIWCW